MNSYQGFFHNFYGGYLQFYDSVILEFVYKFLQTRIVFNTIEYSTNSYRDNFKFYKVFFKGVHIFYFLKKVFHQQGNNNSKKIESSITFMRKFGQNKSCPIVTKSLNSIFEKLCFVLK